MTDSPLSPSPDLAAMRELCEALMAKVKELETRLAAVEMRPMMPAPLLPYSPPGSPFSPPGFPKYPSQPTPWWQPLPVTVGDPKGGVKL